MEEGKGTSMTVKILGIILIVIGCSGVGFGMAANYRMEEKSLRQLVGILDYMECELQFRLTTLPDLCRNTVREFNGIPGKILYELSTEMESQISPDVSCCMQSVLNRNKRIPPITFGVLEQLGTSIGRFDLEGQIKGLESVRNECKRNIEELSKNKDVRLRSYQTLGICAGAALAILLI